MSRTSGVAGGVLYALTHQDGGMYLNKNDMNPPPPNLPRPWTSEWSQRDNSYIYINTETGVRTRDFPFAGGDGYDSRGYGDVGDGNSRYDEGRYGVVGDDGGRYGGGGYDRSEYGGSGYGSGGFDIETMNDEARWQAREGADIDQALEYVPDDIGRRAKTDDRFDEPVDQAEYRVV